MSRYPTAQSHASYEESALTPSHHGWIWYLDYVCMYVCIYLNLNTTSLNESRITMINSNKINNSCAALLMILAFLNVGPFKCH